MQRHQRTSKLSVIQDAQSSAKPRPVLLKPTVLRPLLMFTALLAVLGYFMLEQFGGGSPAIASEHQGDTPAVVELFTSCPKSLWKPAV